MCCGITGSIISVIIESDLYHRCQSEGGGHGGQSDDGDKPACGYAEERQAEEL